MTDIHTRPVTVRLVLTCDACSATAESPVQDYAWDARRTPWAQAMFAGGWRLFMGKRTNHTYCPEHGPKTPMTLLFPEAHR